MHSTILSFWFEELQPAQWWRVDAALDERIRTQFGALHQAAHAGELAAWRDQPDGRLAEIIVLDQFSRNIHRGTPLAFACDPMALALAGACQGSCRVSHAATLSISASAASTAAATPSRSGLSVTAPIGDQSRVLPDQRFGFA